VSVLKLGPLFTVKDMPVSVGKTVIAFLHAQNPARKAGWIYR
jgi:hypothetical protein